MFSDSFKCHIGPNTDCEGTHAHIHTNEKIILKAFLCFKSECDVKSSGKCTKRKEIEAAEEEAAVPPANEKYEFSESIWTMASDFLIYNDKKHIKSIIISLLFLSVFYFFFRRRRHQKNVKKLKNEKSHIKTTGCAVREVKAIFLLNFIFELSTLILLLLLCTIAVPFVVNTHPVHV